VLIETVLKEAQGGQAYANMARAFHLPPEKADAAIAAMLRELIPLVEGRLRSRRALAAVVALMGQPGYEQALESPAQIGATHTQVLGSDALKLIAGHSVSARIAREAAAEAGVSEMISEYLLPVVTTLMVGALARASRPDIARILGLPPQDVAVGTASAPASQPAELPRAISVGAFSGATGGGFTAASAITEENYKTLAADVHRSDWPLGAADPMPVVRRALASTLGADGGAGWQEELKRWQRKLVSSIFPRRS
jgi:hypothetical protein